jgi:hypothetical protein
MPGPIVPGLRSASTMQIASWTVPLVGRTFTVRGAMDLID